MTNQSPLNYLAHFEACLEETIEKCQIPAPRLQAALQYCLFPGGKRLRPHLVYLIGEALEVPLSTLDAIAISIEMVHTYSLVHDDLPAMDDDDLRRGRPSTHCAFDEATAILVGDGLQVLAIEHLIQALKPTSMNPTILLDLIQTLVHAAGFSGMCSGQSLDCLNSANNESELFIMHALKTGKLISACITMPSLASGAPSAVLQQLDEFSKILGLTFQMQDDYLDRYASLEAIGKGRASDAANQKTTFASLYTKAQLRDRIHAQYQQATALLAGSGLETSALQHVVGGLQARCA